MKQREEKGITLIALVITIIILLILAGISIATLTGENGILSKANTAKIETEKAGAKEKVQIAVMGSFGGNGIIDTNTLNKNLEQIEGIDKQKSKLPITNLPATVSVDGYDVTIDEKGKVTIGSIEEEQVDPIYARLYTKNGIEEEVLILASKESAFPDDSGELTLKNDYGLIQKQWTYEDLLNHPEYGEFLKSEEWEEFKKENPDKVEETIAEMCKYLNTGKTAPWLEETGDNGYMYWTNPNLCEIRILNEIKPLNTIGWFSGEKIENIEGMKNLNTSKVTDMSDMFVWCQCETLDLSELDTSNVVNMKNMFWRTKAKTINLNNFNTSKVTDMTRMFASCDQLISLDLQNFDTSNVTTMREMFHSSESLVQLNLSSFNTSNVTTMYYMFSGCNNLTGLDLTSFDTSKVTDMSSMFSGCDNLTGLDLRSFDTSKVTNMEYMFSGCNNLTGLDLRSFDTSKVTNMAYMFSSCSNLTEILVKETWKEPSWKYDMFKGCGVSKVTVVTE